MSTIENQEESDSEEMDEDGCEDGCDCNECELNRVGGSCGNRYYEFIKHITERGFTWVVEGGFRAVYRRKNVVIKIPHVNDGIMDNKVEASAWHKYKSQPTDLGAYLAPCRLLPNGCLMMAFVDFCDNVDKPFWAGTIDSKQVGIRKGKILAFDYALDVTERDQWEEDWNEFSVFFQDRWLDRKPHLRKKRAA